MTGLIIRPATSGDRQWIANAIIKDWGSEIVVAHDQVFHPAEMPGFVAEAESEIVGLVTYRIEKKSCEILTLNAWQEGRGAGTALIEAVRKEALSRGCRRLWLITTNDNLHALHFYQKRGFHLRALRLNSIAGYRKIKPQIPLLGQEGIPIRDEIELEMKLREPE